MSHSGFVLGISSLFAKLVPQVHRGNVVVFHLLVGPLGDVGPAPTLKA